MDYILQTFNLSKEFKHQKAVDNVNINVKRGEIYGFLGQNGAGKTTTIRMIMGIIKPTSGSIELFGEELISGSYNHFGRIGSIIETPGFYSNLTAIENLEIHRRLMGIPDIECIGKALKMVGLEGTEKKQVKNFSLGMKQRLGIARALLHNPELLILDEPTNGLDPFGIKEIRLLLLDLVQKRNLTVIISSHILSEVQQLANRIGIIHKGRLLEEIDYESLQKKNRHYIEIKVDDDKTSIVLIERKLNISDYKIVEPGLIRVYERLNDSGAINRTLVNGGIDVKSISLMNCTLEDYFIEMTGGVINV
ncbi:MAG: ABC transporter ATP-binding protein [Clostridia bacterium]|nr:ABC transporter ATP-binding protein [Clostridia bacterium]